MTNTNMKIAGLRRDRYQTIESLLFSRHPRRAKRNLHPAEAGKKGSHEDNTDSSSVKNKELSVVRRKSKGMNELYS
ncbi:MAG TPA: hypothetical protein VMU10_04300 [Desulfomonilia bacterium]|nr:hypothetical protein [Desulfomonilia bacterium]